MKKIKYAIGIAVAQILPIMALAATPDFSTQTLNLTPAGVQATIQKFLGWATIIVGVFAVLAILYAAFLYMTAGGSEEKVGTAKKAFIYGLVGVGVALLAYVASTLLISWLTYQ